MFVILGATGNVGRSTITALRRAGKPVRAVVREHSKAKDLAQLGCEIAVADLHDGVALAKALDGASVVQVICPVGSRDGDTAAEMKRSIETVAVALEGSQVKTVLAISDYGAELDSGTGITVLFNILEARLQRLSSRLIFLRSAEHMQNWARVMKVAAETGKLQSLHHPLTKLFPTVSAFDVGTIAADILLSPVQNHGLPYIVNAEGPHRYTALDVAKAVGDLLGREVTAYELPRKEWDAMFHQAGLGESYARRVAEMYDAHNAGRIDVPPATAEVRHGQTELLDALRPLVQSIQR
jgi:NAD(P)H dehydrogenase (quinone)